MQSRFFDFGGDTIIRADQYAVPRSPNKADIEVALADMYDSRQIARHRKAGSSPGYPSRPRIGRSISFYSYIDRRSVLIYLQIEVEFKIHGQGNLHGDGMAIWLTKQRGTTGPVFGSTDKFEGLGVFIDTYKNQRPGVVFPYVMAMVGNTSVTYDKDHDGKDNEIAGCSVRSPHQFRDPTSSTQISHD